MCWRSNSRLIETKQADADHRVWRCLSQQSVIMSLIRSGVPTGSRLMGGRFPLRISFSNKCWLTTFSNGLTPTSISHAVMANACMSVRRDALATWSDPSSKSSISGAQYLIVPFLWVVMLRVLENVDVDTFNDDKPKSDNRILGGLSPLNSTFAGFISPWTRPMPCNAVSPWLMPARMRIFSSIGNFVWSLYKWCSNEPPSSSRITMPKASSPGDTWKGAVRLAGKGPCAKPCTKVIHSLSQGPRDDTKWPSTASSRPLINCSGYASALARLIALIATAWHPDVWPAFDSFSIPRNTNPYEPFPSMYQLVSSIDRSSQDIDGRVLEVSVGFRVLFKRNAGLYSQKLSEISIINSWGGSGTTTAVNRLLSR